MSVQISRAVFLMGLIAFVSIRHVFARRTRDNEKSVRNVTSTDVSLLAAVAAGTLLIPIVFLATPWLAFADYHLPAFAPWCGIAVMLASLWLFWRSHADLDRNWSVTLELRKGHQLIQHGVYRRIRHPMYASTWLWVFGQGLLLQNWVAGFSGLITFGILYFIRTPREERMMCEFFGKEYQEYMGRTGRLLPPIKIKRSP